jgi:hypothetical protein
MKNMELKLDPSSGVDLLNRVAGGVFPVTAVFGPTQQGKASLIIEIDGQVSDIRIVLKESGLFEVLTVREVA